MRKMLILPLSALLLATALAQPQKATIGEGGGGAAETPPSATGGDQKTLPQQAIDAAQTVKDGTKVVGGALELEGQSIKSDPAGSYNYRKAGKEMAKGGTDLKTKAGKAGNLLDKAEYVEAAARGDVPRILEKATEDALENTAAAICPQCAGTYIVSKAAATKIDEYVKEKTGKSMRERLHDEVYQPVYDAATGRYFNPEAFRDTDKYKRDARQPGYDHASQRTGMTVDDDDFGSVGGNLRSRQAQNTQAHMNAGPAGGGAGSGGSSGSGYRTDQVCMDIGGGYGNQCFNVNYNPDSYTNPNGPASNACVQMVGGDNLGCVSSDEIRKRMGKP